MRAQLIILRDPTIEVRLQVNDRPVQGFAERYPIELIERGFVKTLANSIGLRTFRLGARVISLLMRR